MTSKESFSDKRLFLIPIFIVLTLAIAGCGLGSAPAGRIPSPDWSRGFPITSNVGGTPDMLVWEGGRSVHFAWPTADDDQDNLHYLRLNEEAEVVVDLDLPLPEGRHRAPRLFPATNDQVQLVWGLRASGSRGWTLWHGLLDESGAFVDQPRQISPLDMRVGDYSVALNHSGEAVVVWEEDPAKGFWAIRLSEGGIESEPVQLTTSGESPGVYLEDDNTLHLAWRDDLDIKYAVYPAGEFKQTEGQVVAQLQDIIANLQDPVIGVAGDWVTILWSVFARSGLESGSGWTEYISFPKGEPAVTAPTRVWVLTEEEQPYADYDGTYALTVLAPAVTSPALTSNYILEPDTATAQGNELAAAISSMQTFRLQEIVQMAVLIFNEGEFDGYQMAGKTDQFSQDGILQSDQEGYMYLAWRDGTGQQFYFASTQPALKDRLNSFGRADFFQAIVGGGLEAVTGVLFFPLSLIWFVPGALLLGIYKLRRDDETILNTSSRILVVVAILLYQGTKILFLPSIIEYIPFSAWLDIPPGIGFMLRIIVPLMTFSLGILAAELVRRRQQETSSLLYFFIACGVDAIFTLMIYGVNFLGVI